MAEEETFVCERDENGQFKETHTWFKRGGRGGHDGDWEVDTRARDHEQRTIARDHAKAQFAVCALCFCKPKEVRKISPSQVVDIQKYLFEPFAAKEWSWLPKVICNSCRVTVAKLKKAPESRY